MVFTGTGASATVVSILQRGIIPATQILQAGIEQTFSVDSRLNDQVSLNCISKVNGIGVSLLHPAKGGLAVAVESRRDLFDAARVRNKIAIERYQSDPDVSNFSKKTQASYAYQKALQHDLQLRQALSDRTYRTALFILQLHVQHDDELYAQDGCLETSRPSVAARDIKHIVLPKRHKDEIDSCEALKNEREHGKFFFVGDTQALAFPFCGLDIKDVTIPDYARALKRFYEESGRSPLFTHMARLS